MFVLASLELSMCILVCQPRWCPPLTGQPPSPACSAEPRSCRELPPTPSPAAANRHAQREQRAALARVGRSPSASTPIRLQAESVCVWQRTATRAAARSSSAALASSFSFVFCSRACRSRWQSRTRLSVRATIACTHVRTHVQRGFSEAAEAKLFRTGTVRLPPSAPRIEKGGFRWGCIMALYVLRRTCSSATASEWCTAPTAAAPLHGARNAPAAS